MYQREDHKTMYRRPGDHENENGFPHVKEAALNKRTAETKLLHSLIIES